MKEKWICSECLQETNVLNRPDYYKLLELVHHFESCFEEACKRSGKTGMLAWLDYQEQKAIILNYNECENKSLGFCESL